jgi:hypothetical protein
MDYIKKNCTLIPLLLLVLVIIISLFTGCKCNEGYKKLIEGHSNHGEKYLKKLKEQNDEQIKKVVDQINSTDDATSKLATLQKLTTADSAITAALKASGGESISSLLGDDDDDD